MPAPRPRIAVSSCLLGNPVRYDGTDRLNESIRNHLSRHFEIVALCPEVEAGLGTPRPPVRLTGSPQHPLALGVEDASLDITAALMHFSDGWLAQAKSLSGLILKSRSPSCGLRDTPVFDRHGAIQSHGAGLFTRRVTRHYPQLPVDDEIGIADAKHRNAFINRVEQYALQRHCT